jgi:hypothetical protein
MPIDPLILPSPLRAITLWQPWAYALIFCGKDVENRPRSLGVTGWVAVHVGLHYDEAYVEASIDSMPKRPMDPYHSRRMFLDSYMPSQRGHIIGLVNIDRWSRRETLSSPWLQAPPGSAAVITRAVPLRTPVLCRNGFHQGAWRVPEDVEQQIKEQLRPAEIVPAVPVTSSSPEDGRTWVLGSSPIDGRRP